MKVKKVLVVEDSKLVHMMYDVMFQKCCVVHATDGQDALSKLAEHHDVDVILLDVNMPRMNGLEFLEIVKRDARLARIPVVVISTEGKKEVSERAVEAGATAFICKPFKTEAIMDVIARIEPAQRAGQE